MLVTLRDKGLKQSNSEQFIYEKIKMTSGKSLNNLHIVKSKMVKA